MAAFTYNNPFSNSISVLILQSPTKMVSFTASTTGEEVVKTFAAQTKGKTGALKLAPILWNSLRSGVEFLTEMLISSLGHWPQRERRRCPKCHRSCRRQPPRNHPCRPQQRQDPTRDRPDPEDQSRCQGHLRATRLGRSVFGSQSSQRN